MRNLQVPLSTILLISLVPSLVFPTDEKDRHNIAFTSVDETRYMFRGCPFGLKPILPRFQRAMDKLFRDLPFVTTFVDDIIVYSKTIAEHANHVRIVIHQLNGAHLSLQEKKCFFAQKCVYLLGFCIHANTIHPSFPLPSSDLYLLPAACEQDLMEVWLEFLSAAKRNESILLYK